MPQAVLEDPDGTLGLLRDSVAALASRHPGPASVRAKRHEVASADSDHLLWKAMADAGWTGLLIPENLGGSALGMSEQAALSEALGRELISEAVSAGCVFAATLLCEAEPSAERDRLAIGLASGSLRVIPAWRQPDSNSGGRALIASFEADGVSLVGDVHFVDSALSATDFLVVAESRDSAVLLSVPGDANGLTIHSRPGVDGGLISSLRFDECRSDLILAKARSVEGLVERAVDAARIALSAELAGIASRAVEMTIDYTRDRVQFGKPIASFQAVQHRLVDMWSEAEFACAALVNAVAAQSWGTPQEARMAILAAKARCGDAAISVCRKAVHLHGAMGFTDEHDIGLYLKRAIALNATLGQPEQLRLEFVKLERAA